MDIPWLMEIVSNYPLTTAPIEVVGSLQLDDPIGRTLNVYPDVQHIVDYFKLRAWWLNPSA